MKLSANQAAVWLAERIHGFQGFFARRSAQEPDGLKRPIEPVEGMNDMDARREARNIKDVAGFVAVMAAGVLAAAIMVVSLAVIALADVDAVSRIASFEAKDPVAALSVKNGTPLDKAGLPDELVAVVKLDKDEDADSFVQATPASKDADQRHYAAPAGADALYAVGDRVVYSCDNDSDEATDPVYRVYGSLGEGEASWFASDKQGAIQGRMVDIPVTWAGDYDANQAGTYVMTASFSGYAYAEARPHATVDVAAAETGGEGADNAKPAPHEPENKEADSEKEKDGKGGEDKAAADTRDGAAEEKDDAKAKDKAEDASPVQTEPATLTADAGDGMKVTVEAPAGTLPCPADELTLSVAPVDDPKAQELVESQADDPADGARRETRLYDVKLTRDGQEVQPAGDVKMTFEGVDAPKGDAELYSLDESAETVERLDAAESGDTSMSAVTQGFPTCAVTWTVDFHFDGGTFSIAGESSVLLSEIFSRLSVGREAADVVSCEFSDPALLSVEREGGDWRLASLAAFSTEERLSCTFPNGDVVEIKVTDAPAGGVAEDYVPGTGEVSGLNVSKATGTAPFDADDSAGNDSSTSNDVVRSFDTVFYNVGYTLNLKDRYQGMFSGYRKAGVYVRATLPLPKEQAAFDLDAMPWLSDARVDDAGAVQTLTGRYDAEAAAGDCAVPSTGSVRFAVSVKAMANGAEVRPTFELWLDDGDNDHHVSAPAETLAPAATAVSAKAAYDVDIEEIGIKDPGTFGPDSYIVSYAVTLNASVPETEKGMRGMLVDIDEASFDIYAGYYSKCKPGVYQGNTSSATLGAYTPRLYDYSLVLNNSATTGQLGKDMTVMSGNGDADMGRRVLPYSSRAESGSADNAAMNSGAMTATQGVGTPDQRIRVTFSGIENDYVYPKEAARPDHLGNTASLGKGSAILACGVIQVEYPRENIPGATSYYAGSTVYRHRYLTAYDDLAVHTSSGNSSITDADPDNDTCEQYGSVLITAQGSGTHMHAYDVNGDWIGCRYSSTSQHEYMHPGDKFYTAVYAGSGYPGVATYGMDGLLYFDTSIYEPLAEDGDDCFTFLYENGSDAKKAIQSQSSVEPGVSVKLYYLQLPNEYIDFFTLQNYPRYESLSEAKAAGVTCNAVFVEARSSTPYYNYYTPKVIVPFKIRDDAQATPATAVGNNTTRWNCITHQAIMYGQDVSGYTLKNYTSRDSWGPGNGHTYLRVWPPHGGQYTHQIYYLSPGRDVYGKFVGSGSSHIRLEPSGTWYQDAAYFGGFTAIIRDKKVSVGKETSQRESGKPRHIYFAGSGERYADYTLSPELAFAGSSVPPDPKYSTVTVTDTLPAGLSYREDSACIGGAYEQPADRHSHGTVNGGTPLAPGTTATGVATSATTTGDVTFTVTPKADGTTELKWVITNVQAGQEMPKLYYGTRIGDESNPADDVADGQQLTNTVQIASTSSQTGNQDSEPSSASWTISVFKMDSATLSKRSLTPEVDVGEDVSYAIDYVNDSEGELDGVEILDVLPYDGDLRGSSFHGSYEVASVTVERLGGAAGSYALSYTEDASVRGHEGDPFGISPAPAWTAAAASESGNVTTFALPAGASPTMLKVSGEGVGAHARARITVTLRPAGNAGGDVYANDAAYGAPSVPAPVLTASADARVVASQAPFSFVKVDRDGAPLAGAAFELYACPAGCDHSLWPLASAASEAAGCWVVSSPFRRAVSGADGTVDFGTLPAGAWMLAETEAPAGFAVPYGQWLVEVDPKADPKVRITAHASPAGDMPPAFRPGPGAGSLALPNYPNVSMPKAGSRGALGATAAGVCLLGVAAALALSRRRRA